MKTSSKTRKAGRRVSAAASKKTEKVTSAPLVVSPYSVSKKDPAGKVVITARGGSTTVPANMANFVIRAAMELTGIAYADASAIQGQTAKSAAAKSAAAKPAAAKPAAAAKAAPKPSASKTSAAAKKPDAKKAAVTGKSTAKPGAKTATKTTPAPASIAGQAPQVARRRPGKPSNAELAGQQVVHPPQSKAKVPETIREFKPKYESAKGQTPPASLTRRFFEQEKKWGYDVTIASRQVGRLLFDHDGVWSLTPTDERLAERNVKVTIHANPISAFVRVTNGWSRALTSQPAAAAA